MLISAASRAIFYVAVSLMPVLTGCTTIKAGLDNISQTVSGNHDFSEIPEMEGYAPTIKASKSKRAFQIAVNKADGTEFKSFVINVESYTKSDHYNTDYYFERYRKTFDVANLEIRKRYPGRAYNGMQGNVGDKHRAKVFQVMDQVNQARFDDATADGVQFTSSTEEEWAE